MKLRTLKTSDAVALLNEHLTNISIEVVDDCIKAITFSDPFISYEQGNPPTLKLTFDYNSIRVAEPVRVTKYVSCTSILGIPATKSFDSEIDRAEWETLISDGVREPVTFNRSTKTEYAE